MVTRMAVEPHSSSWRGVSQHVYDLCRFLRQNGDSVDLYSAGKIRGSSLMRSDRFITLKSLLLSSYLNTLSGRYNLFHVHGGLAGAGIAARNLVMGGKTPAIVTFHSVALARLLSLPRNSMAYYVASYLTYNGAERTTALGAERIIAVSRTVANELTGLYKVPWSKISIIQNGIDISRFQARDKNECRARLGIQKNARMILFVGRIDGQKGIRVLLDAFRGLKTSDVELHLVGAGPLASEVEANSSSDSRIAYHGFLSPESEMKQLLASAADVFVNPSFSEGLAYAVLEMMAWGKSLVLSDIPTHREMATGLARFFECGNSESLARELESALSDDLERSREPSLHRVMTTYSLETMYQKTMEIYQEVRRA